jgi:Lipase
LTGSDNISIPVTQSLLLWAHEKFDPKKKVVVMITGWTTDIKEENTAADELWKAYKSRGDTNFILIDTARYVDTLYTWSAFNTKELGKAVGEGLAELINYVPKENIHLMGHSLGNQLFNDISDFAITFLSYYYTQAHTLQEVQARDFRKKPINFCLALRDLIRPR